MGCFGGSFVCSWSMESLNQILATDNPVIWVFGYGSLLWKHNFNYKSKVVGYIEGYERRFNQGNETFRGTPGKPGRVANLEEKESSKTWGVAFQICGRQEVSKTLHDLNHRESSCGGYVSLSTTFYPRKFYVKREQQGHGDSVIASKNNPHSSPKDMLSASTSATKPSGQTSTEDAKTSGHRHNSIISVPVSSNSTSPNRANTNLTTLCGQTPDADTQASGHRPVQVLLYTATPGNSLYLGPDSLTNMAHQIVESRGSAGTNVEYVLKIAEYVRKYIPEDDDDHLFGLDAKVREELHRRIVSKEMGA